MSSAVTATPAARLVRRINARRHSSIAVARRERRVAVVSATSDGGRGRGTTHDDSDYAVSSITNRRSALLGSVALSAAASTFGIAAPKAVALYNKDLDDPISDPVQAVAVVYGMG